MMLRKIPITATRNMRTPSTRISELENNIFVETTKFSSGESETKFSDNVQVLPK
jgi:hypothetical protein